jgi:ATP-binding cassette, subfamily B, bacterial PglK
MPSTRSARPTHAEEPESSGRALVGKMLELMAAAERRRMFLLLPLVVVNALIQVVGIASVMPFLALVSNPDSIQTNQLLRWTFDTLGFGDATAFMVFVGLGVLVVLVGSNAMAAFTHLKLLRFSWDMNHLLSVRMLREYLYKPYAFFLDQNTSGLAKNILGEVKQAVNGYLVSGMGLVAQTISAALILGLLIAVNPALALISFAFLGGCYGVMFRIVRRRLSEGGRRRSLADKERFKAANEALRGVKDIKLLGREQPFLKRFTTPSRQYGQLMARQQVIAMIPRYMFETIAFGGMLLIVIYLLVREQTLVTVLPTLGVYAFASYRLLPKLQGIFGAVSSMRFSASAIEVLHRDLERAAPSPTIDRDTVGALAFTRMIELDDVTFAYPNAPRAVFENFNLRVRPNTSVALVGATGSGKTTAIDLLLGLLEPQSGHLKVDGVSVTAANMASWQKNLGYVPQEIFLADDTVAANIAFGVPPKSIDREAIERAARQANIHDFIVQDMPHGYDTEIGERGVRLSGGQRQRLGIARALYHDPDILILDEATSALDNVTEESVFGAVNEIGKSKTVVMIAHRLSTVRNCDVIHLLREGVIIAQGSYDELLASSPEFRALARVEDADAAEVTA